MIAEPYYSAAAQKFLVSLRRHNDREWFEPRRAVYESQLKFPTLAVIDAVNLELLEFAPLHVRPAAKSMLRFYRDTRFSTDKSPYQTRVAAWWGQRRFAKTSGAGFYFHFNAREVIIAAGIFRPDKHQLLQVREGLLQEHARFQKLVDALARKRAGSAPMELVEPASLARTPRGFDAGHPAASLLRQTRWGVSLSLPGEAALDPTLPSTLVSYFRRATPLVDLLNSFCAPSNDPD